MTDGRSLSDFKIENVIVICGSIGGVHDTVIIDDIIKLTLLVIVLRWAYSLVKISVFVQIENIMFSTFLFHNYFFYLFFENMMKKKFMPLCLRIVLHCYPFYQMSLRRSNVYLMIAAAVKPNLLEQFNS